MQAEVEVKTLFLLRHAKSSWKDLFCSDHDRLLNKRGRRDAPRMARLLANCNPRPTLIISSTATRAERTAVAVHEALADQTQFDLDARLYHASPHTILDIVREKGAQHETVIVVGHNPGLEDLIRRLTDETRVFPTAALAEIQLSIEYWGELNHSVDASLNGFWIPKALPDTTH